MILQQIEELEKQLHRKELHRVYLVLGPELYHCRAALNLLKKSVITPDAYAFDYSEFTAGEDTVDAVIEAIETFPMIAPRRLVIVTRAEKLKETEQHKLLAAIETMSKRTVLILTADELDHRRRFYKVLCEKGCVAEFPKLKEAALERWAESYVQRQGYRISSASVHKLVEMAGTDLQGLATELEKVILWAGNEKNIPDSAIEDLVRESRHQGIFELIGAIGERNRGKALRSLANLLSMGDNPIGIAAMMARHCRQVLIARECLLQRKDPREIAGAVQMPPYFLDRFLRQVRAADYESIREIFMRLADADRRLKSSSVDGRILLENIICTLV